MTASSRHRATWTAGVVACLLMPAAYASPPSVDQALGGLMTPGITLAVSGARPLPTIEDPLATTPSVSDDGSTLAYGIRPAEDVGDVVVREVLTGRTIDIGNDRGDFANPSLSGDGGRVAFSASSRSVQVPGTESDVDVYVASLGSGKPEVDRVTGTPSDLRYQRSVGCRPSIALDSEPDVPRGTDRCGPQLSGDGSSVAFPAHLSVVAPKLRLSTPDDTGEIRLGYGPNQVGVLDFGTMATEAVIRLRVNRPSPVHLDGAVVTSGAGIFSVITEDPGSARPCADVTVEPSARNTGLRNKQECTIVVAMKRSASACGTRLGTLRIDSPTPRGRTELALVGENRGCIAAPGLRPLRRAVSTGAPVARTPEPLAVCPPPAEPASLPITSADPGSELVTRSLGEVRIGQPMFFTQTVTNPSSSSDLVVHFDDPACGIQFTDSGAGITNPCTEGTVIGPSADFDSCRAIVRVAPGSVAPVAAALSVLPCIMQADGSCPPAGGSRATTAPTRVFRFVAAGTQPVVVIRRDANGDGDFAGQADPPAVQVSVDRLGRNMDGETPTLSGDGRYVAFASTDSGRIDGPQIFVHDTDLRGDRSYVPGPTVMASRFAPGPDGRPGSAIQPSLSGDGRRVAYVTRDIAGQNADGIQVRVRDLTVGTTVLASTRAGTTEPAGGVSFSPSLSRDGSTVAFASTAGDLVAPAVELCCTAIYLRDLGSDFGGPGSPSTEILSLHGAEDVAYADSGLPAMDADGGLTAFESADALLPGTDPNMSDQIYARVRFPAIGLSPTSLTFSGQEIGTTSGHQTVTVTNGGAGPSVVQTVTATGAFAIADGCDQVTLHRAESCVIRVAFAPSITGRQRGKVEVTTAGFRRRPQVDVVSLTGTAVRPTLDVRQSSLTFPDTALGVRSSPKVVTVTNVSGATLSVSGAVAGGDREFLVRTRPALGCREVEPRETCRLLVTFRPLQLGHRHGTVQVIGDLGDVVVTKDVAVSGALTRPTFEFSPTVAQEGRVTFISGKHLMPGTPLTLRWSSGLIATPDIVTRADGSFSAPAVILMGSSAGQRALTVTMPGVKGRVTGPPLLIVTGSAQPPDFVSRN